MTITRYYSIAKLLELNYGSFLNLIFKIMLNILTIDYFQPSVGLETPEFEL